MFSCMDTKWEEGNRPGGGGGAEHVNKQYVQCHAERLHTYSGNWPVSSEKA